MDTVRVLTLPIAGRFILWHAWREAPAATGPPKEWTSGRSLREKATLLGGALQHRAATFASAQWSKLESAPPGTLNARLFTIAQSALSRVDPSESFLKSLPSNAAVLEVLHPTSLQQRLVRRRLRRLAATAAPRHTSAWRWWAAALLPQLPLVPLPLPNVTIYYTLWRIASHYSASKGAAALSAALELSSDVQRAALAGRLRELQRSGVVLQPGSWALQLAQDADRLQQQLEQVMSEQQGAPGDDTAQCDKQEQQQQQQKGGLPLPRFTPDDVLERLVQPAARRHSPLPEDVVEQLAMLYHQTNLLDHYRAACRRCLSTEQQAAVHSTHQQGMAAARPLVPTAVAAGDCRDAVAQQTQQQQEEKEQEERQEKQEQRERPFELQQQQQLGQQGQRASM